MKQRFILLFFASFFSFCTSFQPGLKGCNLSSYSLVSMVESPVGTWTITTRLCLGYGRTGLTFGADGPTNVISLAIFNNSAGDAAIQAALVSWTLTLTRPFVSAVTGPADFSAPFGPGFGIGENDNIIYANTSGLDITCMSLTANCGNVGTHCQDIVLVYTGIKPDSIRAIGVEGIAPFGGCWPNTDMVINLMTLPVVWNQFTGVPGNGGVNLDWTTAEEHNSKEFRLMRKTSAEGDFTQIATIPAAGNSETFSNYRFLDKNPVQGINEYQLVQVDNSGTTQRSEIISVQYEAPGFMTIHNVYPNPASDRVTVEIRSGLETNASLSVWSAAGQLLDEVPVSLLVGVNESSVDVSKFAPGIYLLRLRSSEGVLQKQLIIQ